MLIHEELEAVVKRFIEWGDFAESVTLEHMGHTLPRYRDLCPAWVFEPDDDHDEDSA